MGLEKIVSEKTLASVNATNENNSYGNPEHFKLTFGTVSAIIAGFTAYKIGGPHLIPILGCSLLYGVLGLGVGNMVADELYGEPNDVIPPSY